MVSTDGNKLIISVKEFRKLAGKGADAFSDEQVSDLIISLDFIAELFIKQSQERDGISTDTAAE